MGEKIANQRVFAERRVKDFIRARIPSLDTLVAVLAAGLGSLPLVQAALYDAHVDGIPLRDVLHDKSLDTLAAILPVGLGSLPLVQAALYDAHMDGIPLRDVLHDKIQVPARVRFCELMGSSSSGLGLRIWLISPPAPK